MLGRRLSYGAIESQLPPLRERLKWGLATPQKYKRTSSSFLDLGLHQGRLTTTQRRRSCLHRYRFSRCVCWQYLASTHNRRIYARCFTVTTFPVTNSIHRVAVIGVPLLNGFLHAFIISYTKEKGNAHSSPTYSLWSLKWESPARNRMKRRLRERTEFFRNVWHR